MMGSSIVRITDWLGCILVKIFFVHFCRRIHVLKLSSIGHYNLVNCQFVETFYCWIFFTLVHLIRKVMWWHHLWLSLSKKMVISRNHCTIQGFLEPCILYLWRTILESCFLYFGRVINYGFREYIPILVIYTRFQRPEFQVSVIYITVKSIDIIVTSYIVIVSLW